MHCVCLVDVYLLQTEAPEQFRDNIRAAVQILQENLPR